jgi:glycosyltransferase involved in cell wall biosynthesis
MTTDVSPSSAAQLEQFQHNFDAIQHLINPWFVWPQKITIHMVVNNVHERDGVGNFVIAIYKLLRRHNIPCQLYAEGYEPYLAGLVHPLEHLLERVSADDVVFVHFSIYLPLLEKIATLPAQKVVCYYGITPPSLLRAFDENLADHCQRGYDQGPLIQHFQQLAAISEASAAVAVSFLEIPRAVAVVPPVLNLRKWEAIAAEPIPLPPQSRKFLYVGRVVPHKKVEDLIRLYGEYYPLDPDSCLLIAGFNDFGTYKATLQTVMADQPTAVRERIHFLGPVSDGQLKFLYQSVDAFWMMSEHEGFCIPLVEAMGFELPVFAFAQAAVRETLGEAGLVFYQKDPTQLAHIVYQTLFNEQQRHQMLAIQNQRFQELIRASDGRAIWRLLESCLQQIYASSL